MAREDALHLLGSEFKLWGVRFDHRMMNGGHIELAWRATPDKELRTYVIAKTGGDSRGWLNARADIRRLFRADGLSLKEPVKAKPILHKVLAAPQHVEKDADQIRLLRAEVGELTEMVFELAAVISSLRGDLAPKAEAPVVAVNMDAPTPAATTKRVTTPGIRSIDALDYVSSGWNSTEALARDMGLSATQTYAKLYYLMTKKGAEIEVSGGRWRKNPKLKLVAAAGKRKR